MKRFFVGIASIILAAVASAATLTPIQLLNPSGSTSGQSIVSNGPSSAPSWQAVPLSGIASQAANTVLGNGTASTAAPTALSVPSCSAATNALQWTSGTGFACNSAINASTLGGATFAAPGASGGTTPGSGAFTTLSASSNAKVIAGNAGGQTVASATATVITTWTASVNTGTAFNTTTGVFTAPAAGQYLVTATIGLSGPTWAAGNLVQIVINKNGSTYKIGTTMLQASGTGNLIVATATSLVDLAANDTVSIAAFHNGTGSATTSASLGATGNHLSIVRIP